MTTPPPVPDRYSISVEAFQEAAFTEAELRELFMRREITGDTLVAPEHTAGWKNLSETFPEWAATPVPDLPAPLSESPSLAASPPCGFPVPDSVPPSDPTSAYGCQTSFCFFTAVILSVVSLASAASSGRPPFVLGLPLPWLCLWLAVMLGFFGWLLTFLGDIARRQESVEKKIDRLLEQQQSLTGGAGNLPEKLSSPPQNSGDGKPAA